VPQAPQFGFAWVLPLIAAGRWHWLHEELGERLLAEHLTLACGYEGVGRLAEVETILQAVEAMLNTTK
jgi:chlorite dismutase